MSAYTEDLTPFFADRCWLLVFLARDANVGVILRRGPSKRWHVTLWDTERDRFTKGQWFHGQMYPERCDLSPDGKLFIYFAGKHRRRDEDAGYGSTWIAVSRPPYLTALALWPIGDTWGGDSVFLDNNTVRIATSTLSWGAISHPAHPKGPLNVVEAHSLPKSDARRDAAPSCRSGWLTVSPAGTWKKICGDLTLETTREFRGGHDRSFYHVYRVLGHPLATFEAQWADWDQKGRLVATVGGRVLAGKLAKTRVLWRQLIALNEEKPAPMEAPHWAQRWQYPHLSAASTPINAKK